MKVRWDGRHYYNSIPNSSVSVSVTDEGYRTILEMCYKGIEINFHIVFFDERIDLFREWGDRLEMGIKEIIKEIKNGREKEKEKKEK